MQMFGQNKKRTVLQPLAFGINLSMTDSPPPDLFQPSPVLSLSKGRLGPAAPPTPLIQKTDQSGLIDQAGYLQELNFINLRNFEPSGPAAAQRLHRNRQQPQESAQAGRRGGWSAAYQELQINTGVSPDVALPHCRRSPTEAT